MVAGMRQDGKRCMAGEIKSHNVKVADMLLVREERKKEGRRKEGIREEDGGQTRLEGREEEIDSDEESETLDLVIRRFITKS